MNNSTRRIIRLNDVLNRKDLPCRDNDESNVAVAMPACTLERSMAEDRVTLGSRRKVLAAVLLTMAMAIDVVVVLLNGSYRANRS